MRETDQVREGRLCPFKKKNSTHLDLLSIPQSGGEMSKRLGGIIGGNTFSKKNLKASRPSEHHRVIINYLILLPGAPHISVLHITIRSIISF